MATVATEEGARSPLFGFKESCQMWTKTKKKLEGSKNTFGSLLVFKFRIYLVAFQASPQCPRMNRDVHVRLGCRAMQLLSSQGLQKGCCAGSQTRPRSIWRLVILRTPKQLFMVCILKKSLTHLESLVLCKFP